MKYELTTIPLTKLVITPAGVVMPLCSSCDTTDCGHQIERQVVSVFGINKTMRCLMAGGNPTCVVTCQGYNEKKK